MKRRLLAVLLWAGLASPALAQPSTLTIGLREDPDVLDPTLGSAYVSRIVYASMCDKLIDIDAGLNLVPQLAVSWAHEDPTHLVLHLRPGVVFHDGEPFDAEAVRYKLHRDATIKGSMQSGEVNAIASVEVVDPLTVRLVLHAPSSPLLSQLADRAGIMISHKAEAGEFRQPPGLRRAVCVREPGGAGQHRAASLRPALGRGELSFRPGRLPAAAELVGAAGEPAGGEPRSRRVYSAE